MTREEASNILDDYDVNFDGHTAEEIAEAFEVAFRALEQEPCEDAISRQAALDRFTATKLKKFDFILYAREEIKKLPPVNPQPKTGHWVDRFGGYKCSECGCLEDGHSNYCPDCGACMKDCRTLDEFIEDSKESEE